MNLIPEIDAAHEEIKALRRTIHAHPELRYEEDRTAHLVAENLERWGIDRPSRTRQDRRRRGSEARHEQRIHRPARRHGRAADARKSTRFAHRQRNTRAGCTPAATTATPRCCSARRSTSPKHRDFDGTVVFIFQPAEEGGGGAREMIKDGLFTRFPDRCRLRHAQLAGHAGGPVRRDRGADAWRRATSSASRSAARVRTRRCRTTGIDPVFTAVPDRERPSDHHHAQQEADRHRRDLGHADPHRRGDQRRPRSGVAGGHGAHVHASRCSI